MWKRAWSILYQTFSNWSNNQAPRLGAALAFYSLLSLAPLVILMVSMIAFVFGQSSAREQMISQVQQLIGRDGGETVRAMLEQTQKPVSGIFASLAGLVTLLFGASGVFGELRAALNQTWEIKPRSDGGVKTMLWDRLFSAGMVLSVGFLLVVSLLCSAVLAMVGKFFGDVLPVPEIVLSFINFLVSFAGIALAFSLMFRYVPDRRIAWRDALRGAVLTALLFTVGKHLIGLYLGKFAVGSPYGAAGSLVVVVVWVYYSAMVFLFGAELTRVLESERTASLAPLRSGPPPVGLQAKSPSAGA